MEEYDLIIVGAGIVGLATALKLLEERPGTKLVVLEKETSVAQHQTGHNSGVIHSGIYYQPGSLKALNCKRGYDLMVQFCQEHVIPFDICGKVIVATNEEELKQLGAILEKGIANGLEGIKRISRAECLEIEPYVNAVEAIKVPQAGIVDYSQVCKKYAELIIAAGGEILFSQQVVDVKLNDGNSTTVITSTSEFRTEVLVNCAGLYSDKLAQMTGQAINYKIVPFRGEYYELRKEKQYLVNHLIYPVPNPDFPFLGVHYTRMIGGGIEAGPNAVLAFKREGYDRWDLNVTELMETLTYRGFQKLAAKYWKDGMGEMYRSFSKRAFVNALKHLISDVEIDDLTRGGAGVRAQALKKDGSMVDDFLILEGDRVINVCNAPSPAATSSLAIGETIAQKIMKMI